MCCALGERAGNVSREQSRIIIEYVAVGSRYSLTLFQVEKWDLISLTERPVDAVSNLKGR